MGKWADLVRAAPALALGRDEINRGMVDATRYLDPPPTDEEVAAAAQAALGRRVALPRGPSVGARGAALHAAGAARRPLHDVHRAVDRGRGGDVRPARPVHALLPRRGPVHVRREGRGAAPPLARGEALGPLPRHGPEPGREAPRDARARAVRGEAARRRRAHARDAARVNKNIDSLIVSTHYSVDVLYLVGLLPSVADDLLHLEQPPRPFEF